jgi:tRNA(Leu) C34 or U34 (ribose-2'-O)-methylase TrmL
MSGPVRNLNLSNAVSIVLYEAIRQLSHESRLTSREQEASSARDS